MKKNNKKKNSKEFDINIIIFVFGSIPSILLFVMGTNYIINSYYFSYWELLKGFLIVILSFAWRNLAFGGNVK